jgi:hypothetical protein
MHAILAANAEFYSANLAAEAKKGQIQKAKLGGTRQRRRSATSTSAS